jgi:hypothetical protein
MLFSSRRSSCARRTNSLRFTRSGAQRTQDARVLLWIGPRLVYEQAVTSYHETSALAAPTNSARPPLPSFHRAQSSECFQPRRFFAAPQPSDEPTCRVVAPGYHSIRLRWPRPRAPARAHRAIRRAARPCRYQPRCATAGSHERTGLSIAPAAISLPNARSARARLLL